MAKKVKVALIYDFDGTLSTTDMQNYGLIPTFGMSCKTFWNKANTFGDQNMMEQITSSMYYVFKTAKDKKIPLTRELFFECGKNIQFFEGVENWFERINHYGDMLDLEIEHYVISAGYEEIIEGCAIRKYFKEVYGCAYAYDDKGEAVWPARVVNYSTKTQSLSKINKGLGKLDDRGQRIYARRRKADPLYPDDLLRRRHDRHPLHAAGQKRRRLLDRRLQTEKPGQEKSRQNLKRRPGQFRPARRLPGRRTN